MSEDFDWYISPADRFAAETQFAKYGRDEDEVAFNQLEPLFQLSRLSGEEFSQIWQIVDIRMLNKINKEQFVYFMHILNTRRKGKPLPIGIPLDIKENFLKESAVSSRPFTRTVTDNVRDVGSSRSKNANELEAELEQLTADLGSAEKESALADEHFKELKLTKEEISGIAEYKRRQLTALREEVSNLRTSIETPGSSASAGELSELLAKLGAERQMLETQKAELKRAIDGL